ncbi:putative quinol monooxygenase [Streptomyces aurantiacus]|uniref:ABM domain-containing protein n=1 Tax=Streptomyces aurantiacus TaxID=47760 RepID=A0A7G1P1A4_9ACTN|nr:antibiotic biosynthesis monooxygenase [Streptomyces aurantiacus]BCL28782.1 hypothetical protein GCM10017557_36410 [Streptomyces aurantiacus]
MTYGLVSKFPTQPGKSRDLADRLLQAAKLLERDPGCIHYLVSTSDEPDTVWVLELWTDKPAHDASLEPEDIRTLVQQARPLIAGIPEQTHLTVHGGKGLPS